MLKRLLHQVGLGLLLALIFTLAAGIIVWKEQGLRLYSMPSDKLAPSLRRGDLLLVSVKNLPAKGSFIAYADPINSRAVIMQRFNRQAAADNYIGVAVKALPLAGYGLEALRRPAGLALFIYTPAFMILRAESRRLRYHLDYKNYQATPATTAVAL